MDPHLIVAYATLGIMSPLLLGLMTWCFVLFVRLGKDGDIGFY